MPEQRPTNGSSILQFPEAKVSRGPRAWLDFVLHDNDELLYVPGP